MLSVYSFDNKILRHDHLDKHFEKVAISPFAFILSFIHGGKNRSFNKAWKVHGSFCAFSSLIC